METVAQPAVVATTAVTKRGRHKRTADFVIFEDAARKLNLSTAELAAQLGYAKTSAYKWQQDGRFPYSAALGCEALLKRRLHAGAQQDNTLSILLRVQDGRVIDARPITGEKTAVFDRQHYLLVPIRGA